MKSLDEKIEVKRRDVLDAIYAVPHRFQSCWNFMFEWLEDVSDEEIEIYAREYLDLPQYGEEDYLEIMTELKNRRDEYREGQQLIRETAETS